MEPNVERQTVIRPPEGIADEDQVSTGRDRQEFTEPLNHAENDGSYEVHLRDPFPVFDQMNPTAS